MAESSEPKFGAPTEAEWNAIEAKHEAKKKEDEVGNKNLWGVRGEELAELRAGIEKSKLEEENSRQKKFAEDLRAAAARAAKIVAVAQERSGQEIAEVRAKVQEVGGKNKPADQRVVEPGEQAGVETISVKPPKKGIFAKIFGR